MPAVDVAECFSQAQSCRVEETDRPSREADPDVAPLGVICPVELSSSSIPFNRLFVELGCFHQYIRLDTMSLYEKGSTYGSGALCRGCNLLPWWVSISCHVRGIGHEIEMVGIDVRHLDLN